MLLASQLIADHAHGLHLVRSCLLSGSALSAQLCVKETFEDKEPVTDEEICVPQRIALPHQRDPSDETPLGIKGIEDPEATRRSIKGPSAVQHPEVAVG